jgi:hypothetical protein
LRHAIVRRANLSCVLIARPDRGSIRIETIIHASLAQHVATLMTTGPACSQLASIHTASVEHRPIRTIENAFMSIKQSHNTVCEPRTDTGITSAVARRNKQFAYNALTAHDFIAVRCGSLQFISERG